MGLVVGGWGLLLDGVRLVGGSTPSVYANNRLQAAGGVDLDPPPLPKWSGGGVDLEFRV